jgi:ABC-type antimicrobial peptide transport system permease subunit
VAAVSTDHRRTEIGVRLALGAVPGRLVGMIVRQEMRMVVLGLIVGLVAAVLIGRMLSTFLFGTPPTDIVTFFTAAGLMLAASVGACLIPAMRAANVDPLRTLRSD